MPLTEVRRDETGWGQPPAAEGHDRSVTAPARPRSWGGLVRPSMLATVSTSFTIFGLTAVQGIILARVLGPEARGEYGTAIFFVQTLTYVGLLGTQYSVARRAAQHPAQRPGLSRAVLRLGPLTGLGTIILVAALALVALPADKQSMFWPCIVCSFCLPIEQTRLLLLAVDQGSGLFQRYNLVQVATAAVFPLALVPMWIFGTPSVWLAVGLFMVPSVVGLALRLALGRQKAWSAVDYVAPNTAVKAVDATLAGADDRPAVKSLVKQGMPYLLSVAISDLYGRLDIFLFVWLASFSVQGFYAVAVPAASILLVAPNALALFSFNAGSRRSATLSKKRMLLDGAAVAGFQLAVAAVFALLMAPVIRFMYGSQFEGALPFALALLPAQALNGFVQVAEGHLRGRGKVAIGIWTRLIAAVVMAALVAVWFQRLHEISIPLAALVAHALVAAVVAWFVIADLKPEPEAASMLAGGETLS